MNAMAMDDMPEILMARLKLEPSYQPSYPRFMCRTSCRPLARLLCLLCLVDGEDLTVSTGSAAVSTLMLQRRLETKLGDTDRQNRSTPVPPNSHIAGSFENELKELYLQQRELEKSFRQDPLATGAAQASDSDSSDSMVPNVSDVLGAAAAAGNTTAEAVEDVANFTKEATSQIHDFLANHSTDQMMIYWFGPSATWSCADSTFSTAKVCGYFGGWLSWQVLCFVLFVPFAVCVLYLYFILDLVLIDVNADDFDDEQFQRQHGWSLVQHQWELKYILGSVALPLELIILWQLGLLQVLLAALEPYFVAVLIICTGLAPVLITSYIRISRRFRAIYSRFEAVEQLLEGLANHLVGDFKKIKEGIASINPMSSKQDAKSGAPRSGGG